MINESFFKTTEDGTEIFVNRFRPDDGKEIKAVIQFHHGMEEYSNRYRDLAERFTAAGFVFNAFDARGFGETAKRAEEKGSGKFGMLADKNGFEKAADDLFGFIQDDKALYPGKKVFILSYSFGSFVTQRFMEKYGKAADGCILLGTKGPSQFVNKSGALFCGFFCLFGKEVMADIIRSFPFPIYLRPYKNPRNSYVWMCSDQSVVDKYLADPWCGFGSTREFIYEMMSGLARTHKRKNLAKIPQELPVLFLYGKDDPVGEYGKTIQKLYKIFLKNGMTDVDFKEYENCRHELLKDVSHLQVEKDILSWVEKHL